MKTDGTPKKKLWFVAKCYGYGWTPASLEGWLVLALYLSAIWGAYVCQYTRDLTGSYEDFIRHWFLPQVFGLTFMLFVICFLKGEKPGWRWGNKSEKAKRG